MVKTGTTLMGAPYRYEGSLAEGLTVYFKTTHMRIKPETIQIIRDQIDRRSPVLMGANRLPLVRNSVGETLYQEHGVTPQTMSYVLPLLVQEEFCRVSHHKPFMITRTK